MSGGTAEEVAATAVFLASNEASYITGHTLNVNGGMVMRPYLVDEVRSPELDVLDKADPEELSQAVSAQAITRSSSSSCSRLMRSMERTRAFSSANSMGLVI